MSESAQHQQLVNQILQETIHAVGLSNSCFIMSDAIDGRALPPLTEEGFRPDVYYQYADKLVIGEAKTSDDVDRKHSKRQYESYIRKCALFCGTAILFIAVPWTEHATVHNTLRKIKAKYPGDYEIRILDGIGGAI